MESSVQIIPFYSQPYVQTVIYNNSGYEETVATVADPDALPYATAVATGSDSGIDNTWVRLSDLSTKKSIFGAGNYQKYGQSSLQADALFDGNTNVWFCRVLPDNATYSNFIVMAEYRRSPVLNGLNQETGKYQMDIKFSIENATISNELTTGATSSSVLKTYVESLRTYTSDPLTGYLKIPIAYFRSVGRGNYGNSYSLAITRDADSEKEYSRKMYRFNLINNSVSTSICNIFVGSLYQGFASGNSTLISDVLAQYSEGSIPIDIQSLEDNIVEVYDFYKSIVEENTKYVNTLGNTDIDSLNECEIASTVTEDTFDILFGKVLNTTSDETIPFYRNYTEIDGASYIEPTKTIPESNTTSRPLNVSAWTEVFVGATVLMASDPLNGNLRWLYTVISIDVNDNIIYDEGVESAIDSDQYVGVDLTSSVGISFQGGHDGDFEEFNANGVSRAPTDAEFKLLLSREYVKAFRGQKDKKILSPSRVNIDFIFDANYNMTADETLSSILTSYSAGLYAGSTVLTDGDLNSLTAPVTPTTDLTLYDLNVKRAIYDLVQFRNVNGIELDSSDGAGCSAYFDCNLTGDRIIDDNYEIADIIYMMDEFQGRAFSVDLGYYQMFDPYTGRRIKVTAVYKIASNLVKHIMIQGLNKAYVYKYAQLSAVSSITSGLTVAGDMIKDTFAPNVDMIDWDVKEALYKSRLNYWLTTSQGRIVQRAVQNTREMDASALLEESNVRVLNTLKKKLEESCQGYLYSWNNDTVRKGFTDAQMDRFSPWIGTIVEDLQIYFAANEWEQERMIMHCYVSIKFPDIIKRIILEINVNS